MQITETNRWIKANEDWLSPDTAPMVHQLRMLSKSMDTEMKKTGRVSAGVATAYRQAFKQLMEMKKQATGPTEDDDDDLLNPA